MMFQFIAELNPKVEIKINDEVLFYGNAQNEFTVNCKARKGTLKVTMFDKNPNNQPIGKDKHIRLTHVEFDELVLDEAEIYKLFNPTVRNEKTLYLGFNSPDLLSLKVEHPYNKLIRRLALLSER